MNLSKDEQEVPRHGATVGSYGVFVSYEQGTPAEGGVTWRKKNESRRGRARLRPPEPTAAPATCTHRPNRSLYVDR